MFPKNLILLYAEDEAMISKSFIKIFEKYFSKVFVANNGKDALQIYYKNEIDVAIIDASVAQINGVGIVKEMRHTSNKLEIIMLSAYADKDILIDALNSNVFTYLVKPVEPKELEETIKNLLDKLNYSRAIPLGGNYSFNTETASLFYKNETVKISKSEKKLLRFLCEHSDSYHSATEISHVIFQHDTDTEDSSNNVVQIISRFKKKMLDLHDKEDFFIDNIYGLGYKIVQ